MMKKNLLVFAISILTLTTCSQNKADNTKLNLSFEQLEKVFFKDWHNFGSPDYLVYVDSTYVNNGKYSAIIEYQKGKDVNFKALVFTLPENYEGREITLSGYIKTENVTDGYAGLWMRIDPQIAFDNMHGRGATGDSDWTRYEVTLPMNPSKNQQIVIGGLLVGKGKMWLDDLNVTIDGKDISEAKPYIKELLPAEKDKEFDTASDISFPTLNKQLIVNLELLGKLWGFMKYNHPEIGKGNYNWDYELFRILPQYLKVESSEERDKVLLNWIEKYGELSVCTDCKPTIEDAILKPDLSWIDNSDISLTLKKK